MYRYRDGRLYCDDVDLAEIAARGRNALLRLLGPAPFLDAWHAYDQAFGSAPHLICYAVKANSTLALLSMLAREGSGFDIVSGGELFRVIRAGGDPAKVVFSGVGKTDEEMEYALREGIACFNRESESERHNSTAWQVASESKRASLCA